MARESSGWDFAAVILPVSTIGLASGLTLPLVSIRLSEGGASDTLISGLGAVPALGTLLMAPLLPRLARLLGARRVLLAAMVLSAVALTPLAFSFQAGVWTAARLAAGASASALFAVGEARILELAGDGARARWAALYASCLTGCQLAGPSLLSALGVRSPLPLGVGVALHLLAIALMLARPWAKAPGEVHRSLGFLEFLGAALPIATGVTFFSMFDSITLVLLPVYGLHAGFTERGAVLMATVVLLGDTCLQWPLGWAADKLGRGRLHAACGVLTAGCALLLWFRGTTPLVWPTLFVLGGSAGGIYTLAIVRVGDELRGSRLLAASAYVSLLWGCGGLLAPWAGELFVHAAGDRGIFLFITVGAAAFLVSHAVSAARRGRHAMDGRPP